MIDVDLHNIQILTSQDIDLVQVSHVKAMESQNNYLKYGLIATGILSFGFLYYLFLDSKKDKKS